MAGNVNLNNVAWQNERVYNRSRVSQSELLEQDDEDESAGTNNSLAVHAESYNVEISPHYFISTAIIPPPETVPITETAPPPESGHTAESANLHETSYVTAETVQAPVSAHIPEDEADDSETGDGVSWVETTICTRAVEAEIENLKQQRQQLQSQLDGMSEADDRRNALERRLALLDVEIARKDTDAYKKANARITHTDVTGQKQ
jgi:hypothetical protein